MKVVSQSSQILVSIGETRQSTEVGLQKGIQPRVYSKYRPAGGRPFRSKSPANKETSGDETLNESGAEALLEVLLGSVSTA